MFHDPDGTIVGVLRVKNLPIVFMVGCCFFWPELCLLGRQHCRICITLLKMQKKFMLVYFHQGLKH